jgi:hypothetical protein
MTFLELDGCLPGRFVVSGTARGLLQQAPGQQQDALPPQLPSLNRRGSSVTPHVTAHSQCSRVRSGSVDARRPRHLYRLKRVCSLRRFCGRPVHYTDGVAQAVTASKLTERSGGAALKRPHLFPRWAPSAAPASTASDGARRAATKPTVLQQRRRRQFVADQQSSLVPDFIRERAVAKLLLRTCRPRSTTTARRATKKRGANLVPRCARCVVVVVPVDPDLSRRSPLSQISFGNSLPRSVCIALDATQVNHNGTTGTTKKGSVQRFLRSDRAKRLSMDMPQRTWGHTSSAAATSPSA